MSAASELTADLVMVKDLASREVIYRRAERDYGKNFADHLRDVIEAHHLISNNERDIRSSTSTPAESK